MPLLNVVNISSFNTTFFSCFVFLNDETEADYEWALACILRIFNGMSCPNVIITDRELALIGAISKVFSTTKQILYAWHINKNVLAKCKCHFDTEEQWTKFMKMWQTIIGSVTEQEFMDRWNRFIECYKNKPNILNYIQETWISYKEHFIFSWTNCHLHLSNKETSRVEGAHAVFKKCLQSSMGDLEFVYRKIVLQVESQIREIRVMISSERMKIHHTYQISLFEPFLCRVSVFALKKIYDELIKASDTTQNLPLRPCKKTLKSTIGLPCSHIISECLATGQLLQLNDIHEHWWIQGRCFEFLEDPACLADNSHNDLQPLLQCLIQQYKFWPSHQQAAVRAQIKELGHTPSMVLKDPVTTKTWGRPIGAKN
ncbi:15593_t:CDS:1 [Cetraspora pellucida]|uniref:15593_t:CDS:1 n=1 Tax=Cetraspora pellucida TaxID=1433469 RepID=A0A9N9BFM6_9GLOM|nr:15593_t:CDS:1 [Cetraspora pellucida]